MTTTDVSPAARAVLDGLGLPPDTLDPTRPVDSVLLALVDQHVQTHPNVRWVLDRPLQAAVAAWHASQATFIVGVQVVDEFSKPAGIQLFGPFHDEDAAGEFGQVCDRNGLSFEYWDPGHVTLTERHEVQAPTVANLAKHYDLYDPYEGLGNATPANGETAEVR